MCSALYLLTCLKSFAFLRASRRTSRLFKRVTQSIPLSKIHARLDEPGPKALETLKPNVSDRQNCFQLEATLDGIELETANENLVELTGIEPVTSCLQSTRSPN